VVGDPAEGDVGFAVRRRGVFLAGEFFEARDNRAQDIGFKGTGETVDGGGGALQTHSGIDVLFGEGDETEVIAFALPGELGEDEVPDFEPAGTVALPVGVVGELRLQVEVDFRAGTARSLDFFSEGVGGPVVLVFVETGNALGRETDGLGPEVVGFVVFLEDGDTEVDGVEFEDFGEELPSPGDGFVFEVVAKGEVAEHLKEGAVGDVADAVDVDGAETFLRGGHGRARRDFSIFKVGFKRHHTGDDEHESGVVGDEGVGGMA